MDLELADDQRMIQESVRRFAAAEVRPGAKARDHSAAVAKELFPRLAELGLFELSAMGMQTAVIALEELARQDASLAFRVALANFQADALSDDADASAYLGLRSAGYVLGARSLSAAALTAVGAVAVGISRAAFEDALAYAHDRKQFGKELGEFQAIQWMLADMATETDAARLLVHRAAGEMGGLGSGEEVAHSSGAHDASQSGAWGGTPTVSLFQSRVFACEAAVRTAMKAIQIHGGIGYTRELPVERYCRDAKALEIFAGGSDLMRSEIARGVLVG